MKRKTIYTWNMLLLTLLISTYSCKKHVETKYFISVEKDGKSILSGLEINAEGLTNTFTVKSNGSWHITASGEDISWLIINPNFGQNNGSFNLAAETNTTPFERTALLTVSVNEQEYYTIPIKQESKAGNPAAAPINPSLDVIFKADGTAEDISAHKYPISTLTGLSMTTVYHSTYQRYAGRFSHTPGASGLTSGFYRMDYSSDPTFRNTLETGHTLESMFMLDIDRPLPNVEFKMLSTHQSGGTGLMIGNNANNNAIIFLCHVGGSYVWANSGITPERGKLYHVVGTWDKQQGKSQIYINGELKASVSTSGNFKFPTTGSDWLAVGADPATSGTAQTGWTGDVLIARVYDKALTAADVEKLWSAVETFKPSPYDIHISDISLASKKVVINTDYTIKGVGFMPGDKIKMTSILGQGEYLCEGITGANSFSFKIPANFTTGQYRFYVVRNNRILDLGFALLTVVTELPKTPKIIAHRGYWKSGAPQNSIAALARAQELDIYGSECDIWITSDGQLVINHDATINSIRIENVPYSTLKDITLVNGEKLPRLQDYLAQGKKDPSLKLILELKNHSNSTNGISNTIRATEAMVNMVKASSMTEQVVYIAWRTDVCAKILEMQPTAKIAYLNGDLAPQQVHAAGFTGINYNISIIRNNISWIAQAQNLGLTVNVWTVNNENDILEMIDKNVDFISTDDPKLAIQLINNR